MICKNCGARIANNAGFCGKCGAKAAPAQPSREEIRARVQGGGRQAAPVRSAAPARRAAPSGGAMPQSLDKSRLFVLAAALLSLLQIVYLFVKSVFISISYGGESISDGASMFSVLKEGNATFLAVLLLLLCLALVASIAVPVLLRRGQKPIVTIVIAGLLAKKKNGEMIADSDAETSGQKELPGFFAAILSSLIFMICFLHNF